MSLCSACWPRPLSCSSAQQCQCIPHPLLPWMTSSAAHHPPGTGGWTFGELQEGKSSHSAALAQAVLGSPGWKSHHSLARSLSWEAYTNTALLPELPTQPRDILEIWPGSCQKCKPCLLQTGALQAPILVQEPSITVPNARHWEVQVTIFLKNLIQIFLGTIFSVKNSIFWASSSARLF